MNCFRGKISIAEATKLLTKQIIWHQTFNKHQAHKRLLYWTFRDI